jgi:hypothetical protein
VHVKPLIIAASGDTYLVAVSREDQRRQPETLAVTYYEKVLGVLGGEAQTKDQWRVACMHLLWVLERPSFRIT